MYDSFCDLWWSFSTSLPTHSQMFHHMCFFSDHFLFGGMTLHFLCPISLYSLLILYTRQTVALASSRLRVGTNSIRIKGMLWWSTCPPHTHTHVSRPIFHTSFACCRYQWILSVSVSELWVIWWWYPVLVKREPYHFVWRPIRTRFWRGLDLTALNTPFRRTGSYFERHLP
jgi:hypothetical protein